MSEASNQARSPVLSLIAAVARQGVIGKDNRLLWHLPEDMKYFRETTRGRPVIMGRKTWESLPVRFRPLPGRRNIVLTRTATYAADGAEVSSDLASALDLVGGVASVIGGGEIYSAAMEHATRLRVTEIGTLVDGADAFAPAVDPVTWEQAAATDWLRSRTGTLYRFLEYRRIHYPAAGARAH